MPMGPRCFASLLASALVLLPALASAEDPSQDTAPPAGPSPRARRNVPMAIAGGVVMGVGLATFVTGIVVKENNMECARWDNAGGWLSGFSWCAKTRPRDSGLHDAAIGMMVGGALTVVLGIPLLVVGLRKRAVSPPVAALLGKPAPGGWAWSF